MNRRFIAVYVPLFIAILLTFGIGIGMTMVVCGPDAFGAMSAQGQCSATDTPSEALGSFTILGAMASLVFLAIWTAVRLFGTGKNS